MTATDRLTRARTLLSQAHEELDAVTGLDELEHGAVVLVRSEVAALVRKLGTLVIFATKAAR
jgi:hypothetical protein